MSAIQRTEIPFSKAKILSLLFSCLVFVGIGILLFFVEPSGGRYFLQVPAFRYGVAIASILFFGAVGFFLIKSLRKKEPGLIIDEHGMKDLSSAAAVGFIPWTEIIRFSVVGVMNQKFLIVEVRNPQNFIKNQPSALKRKSLEYNLKHYGSPISISANALKIRLDELKNLLEKDLELASK